RVPNLSAIVAGPRIPNPAEQLAGAHIREFFRDLTARFDVVVVDTAPVNSVSDTISLLPHAQVVLLVVRAGRTAERVIQRAITEIHRAGSRIAGVVMNQLPRGGGYGYYYYYYSKDGYKSSGVYGAPDKNGGVGPNDQCEVPAPAKSKGQTPTRSSPHGRMLKTALRWGALAFIAIIAAGELIARYVLGLGTPPLSMTHPSIEYLFRPNQDVHRFGHHFMVNAYGMRSDPFAVRKAAGELRVLVFGDSVVNGGNLTDHQDLATELLRHELERQRHTAITVGNVSAGSWGPGNWLAYAREFGFFDADIVVLVISSHDSADNPSFAPLNPATHPTRQPVSALVEGIERYLPRYLPRHTVATEADHFEASDEAQMAKGLSDLRAFLLFAQQSVRTVLVFQHLEMAEITSHSPQPGYSRIREVCGQVGIEPVSLEPFFRRSMEQGSDPYRDNIHPNVVGQRLIKEAILAHLPR
ncbi:MAG: hypothetical protein KIT22_11080, partial [Verrucomicrobiae bacterium]|nr:hypothetical protein [Verrucomicrobiae bacterium]